MSKQNILDPFVYDDELLPKTDWKNVGWWTWTGRVMDIEASGYIAVRVKRTELVKEAKRRGEDAPILSEEELDRGLEEAKQYCDGMPNSIDVSIDALYWRDEADECNPVAMWLCGHALHVLKDGIEDWFVDFVFKDWLESADIPEDMARQWMTFSKLTVAEMKSFIEGAGKMDKLYPDQ